MSLRLISVSETKHLSSRFDQIFGSSIMLKYFSIFQKISSSSDLILFRLNVFYLTTLHHRNQFFSNKTNSYSFSKKFKCYIKMLTLTLSAALWYLSTSVRNRFLHRALKYLPIEDNKPFGMVEVSIPKTRL